MNVRRLVINFKGIIRIFRIYCLGGRFSGGFLYFCLDLGVGDGYLGGFSGGVGDFVVVRGVVAVR